MQRAAASVSHQNTWNSSPLSASSPQDLNRPAAGRQKISSSVPQSPDSNASTPRALCQPSDPTTSLTTQSTQSLTRLNCGGNEAESPWVLNTSGNTGTPPTPNSPPEDTLPQHVVTGRRTFGSFKKKTTDKAPSPKEKEDDGTLSSGDPDEDYEQYADRMIGKTSKSGGMPQGKRRHDRNDDRMDQVNLKKLKTRGISASSGLRQPAFDGKPYKKDKRKG